MLLNARRLAQESSVPQMVLLAMEDVTERKRLDERVRISEIRYRRLFEAAMDGVLLIDPDTRKILDANPFVTELMGYSRTELMGKELFEIGLLKDEAASRKLFRELEEKGFIRYDDLLLETRRGERRYVEMANNLYKENGEDVMQCNIRDITQRKEAEESLRQNHAKLQAHAEELSRFNDVAVGRELRMIELKKEINELCRQQGQPVRYPLEFEREGDETDERS